MITNLKKILLILFVLIAIIFICFVFKNRNKKKNEIENEINETKKIDLFNSEIINGELINMLIHPGNDWSQLPLSDHFRSKFDSKYGVLGDIKADKIELDPYTDGRFSFDNYSYILVTQGLKQTAYIYHLDEKYRMWDDFWLTQTYEITDEFGNKLDAVSAINEKTFGVSFRKLAWGEQDEKSVAVTPRFHKKYPYFLDLFIHYSPLIFNHIELVEEKSSWEKKEAYFIVDSKLECKKRNYLVEFTLDDKGYLDDAVVHMVNEEKYEKIDVNNDTNKLFYKFSDWKGIKLTDNFLKNHAGQDSIFCDIDNISNNFYWTDEYYKRVSIKKGVVIYAFKWKDGKFRYYLQDFRRGENDYIDEFNFIKIPYDEYDDIDKVKEAYIKDNNINID